MKDEPEKGAHRGRFLGHLLRKMEAGLLVVIPLGITLFVLRFLFNLADGLLAPAVRQAERLFFGREYYIPGLGMITGLLVIYFSGILVTNVLGRRLFHWWERFLGRIPVVKSIYSPAKQVLEIFSHKERRASFRQAVYLDFPEKSSFSFAYLTNRVVSPSGKRYCVCFVPAVPNPTSGYVVILEESRVYPADLTVEEAMKAIMSGGMVAPEVLRAEKFRE